MSEINDKLSPKKDPPTTTATMNGRAISVFSASPTATGVRATIVPTLVPMDREMKQAAINIPANSRLSGRICRSQVDGGINSTHFVWHFAQRTGENEYPYHQEDILIGSSYRELIDTLV